jgi:hypothetical protein
MNFERLLSNSKIVRLSRLKHSRVILGARRVISDNSREMGLPESSREVAAHRADRL